MHLIHLFIRDGKFRNPNIESGINSRDVVKQRLEDLLVEKRHPEKRYKITELRIKRIKSRNSMETTIENTDQNNSDMLIGYSALKIFDECYEYNEDACYIADTPVSLKEFLDGAMLSVEDYRIESVSISDILNDFGYSSGEYALEPNALEKFERAAKELEITYTVKPYEDNLNIEKQADLFVVKVVEKKKTSQISRKDKIERKAIFKDGSDRENFLDRLSAIITESKI